MVCPDCERWHEKVEGGEPSGGGSDIGLRGGREQLNKTLGVEAVESTRDCFRTGPSRTSFVTVNVVPGRIVVTDGWPSAAPLGRWATVRAPRGTRNRPRRRCRRGIVCSGTATRGCAGRTRGSDINISRPTWTSSQSASSSIELRGPPFTPCSASGASRYPRPRTRCMGWS